MIGLIDTGVSNINSLIFSLQRLKLDFQVLDQNISSSKFSRFLIPGVGNFSFLAKNLKVEIKQLLEGTDRPVLGICLGMQILFESSDEGDGRGLEILNSRIERLPSKVSPHMGWNSIKIESSDPLLAGLSDGDDFYFVHSYADLNNENQICSTQVDNIVFSSVVRKDNFYGVQFHPEKSGRTGEILLSNFGALKL